MLFCQTRELNGAKGEEKPMHKQRRRSVTATPPLQSNFVLGQWSDPDAEVLSFCDGHPVTEGLLPGW